jgi:hypothetical protein
MHDFSYQQTDIYAWYVKLSSTVVKTPGLLATSNGNIYLYLLLHSSLCGAIGQCVFGRLC